MTEKRYEIEFVGYMCFTNEEEAREFAYELEKHLGYFTRNDCNLYLSNLKEMDSDDVICQ